MADYKVTGFDTTTNILNVQYADNTGGFYEPVLCVQLQVTDGKLPTGSDLDAVVMAAKPVAFLESLTSPPAASNHADILALVEQPTVVDRNPQNVPWDVILAERTRLLEISDWTQIPDNPMSEEKRQAWKTWRQQLRDITKTFSKAEDVVWPTPPVTIPSDVPTNIHEAHYLQYSTMKYDGSIFWRDKVK